MLNEKEMRLYLKIIKTTNYKKDVQKKLRMYIKPVGEYPYKLEEVVELELQKIDDRHYGDG